MATYITGSKGTTQECKIRIRPNALELLRQFQCNALVDGSSIRRSWVLMRLYCLDFRIHSLFGASYTCEADLSGVSLQSLIHQCSSHQPQVSRGFSISKSLVSSLLLEAVKVGHASSTAGCSCIAKKSKYSIFDAFRVILAKCFICNGEEQVVRMFLRNFSRS